MTLRFSNQMEKFPKFPDAPELAVQLRTYSVKRWPTMNHEWRKAKLASMLRMKARRLASYWYAEETLSPRVDEVEAILTLLDTPTEDLVRANDQAFRELQERVARLESLLDASGALGTGGTVVRAGETTDGGRRGDEPHAA